MHWADGPVQKIVGTLAAGRSLCCTLWDWLYEPREITPSGGRE
jgi:hypothetical protein